MISLRTKYFLAYMVVAGLSIGPSVVFGALSFQGPLGLNPAAAFLGLGAVLAVAASHVLSRYFYRAHNENIMIRLQNVEQGVLTRYEDENDLEAKAIDKMANRLSRRIRENEHKLRILFEITSFVSSLLHLQHVLDAIVDLLMREFKLDACLIRLIEDDGILRVRSQKGLSDDFCKEEDRKPTLGSYSGECFLTGKIIIVNDAEKAEKEQPADIKSTGSKGSFALTPIIVEGKTIGVLSTCSGKKDYFHRRFNDAISTICNQIGIAIRISRLYGEIYAFSQDLEEKVRERTARLEEKTRQLIEAEKDAALGKMANRVAHELRNSLTVVGGFTRRLYERTPENDPDKGYLDIVVEEVKVLEEKVWSIIRSKGEEF